jgi:acetamidase/formamidase
MVNLSQDSLIKLANTISAGYDDYQIYLLLSCAPVQGHVAGIVDVRAFYTFLSTKAY